MYMAIAIIMTLLRQLKTNWPKRKEFIILSRVFSRESRNKWEKMMETTKSISINTMELLALTLMESMIISTYMIFNGTPSSQDKIGMDLVQRESTIKSILKALCILIVICWDSCNLCKEKSQSFYTMVIGMLLSPMWILWKEWSY